MDQEQILRQLQHFFPDDEYSSSNFTKFIDSGELEIDQDKISDALRGALLDESVIEVEIEDLKQIFFCRVLDHPHFKPDQEGSENEQPKPSKPGKLEKGIYLDEFDHIIITPLEPGMGNYLISATKTIQPKILLRIIRSGTAVELGCYFQQRTSIEDMPVLELSFPLIAKITSGVREFRAKVPEKFNFKVVVERLKKGPITTRPINISLKGMALVNPMGRRSNLEVGEKVVCDLQIVNENPVVVESIVKHATRLRDSQGVQYCFGVQFDLSRPDIKASIEKLVALVQRKHLQELSQIEEKFGISFLK